MLGHERRQERREERREERANRYRLREKLIAIGDDYWIEDDSGRRAYKVNGKALRLRKTFVIEGPDGTELLKIKDHPIHIRDTMEIENASGTTVATVKKALVNPLRARFHIELEHGAEWKAHGNVVDHEFKIEADGTEIAEISKRWFRVRDTYGVQLEPGQDAPLVLAVTVCIDEMGSH